MTTKNLGAQGFRWFFGRVVDRLNDPLKLGRVKVRVYGIHDDEGAQPDDLLPWAVVLTSTISASNHEVGVAPVGITEGSVVWGFFIDGMESQLPVVVATVPGIPDEHDVPKLAREINSLQKQLLGIEPPSAYASKYPFNKVFQTESGHVIEIDDTQGAERIHIYHRSGSYTEIDATGRRVDKIVGDSYEIVAKDKKVYINGTCTVDILGSSVVNIRGNAAVNVDGESHHYTKGTMTIESEKQLTLKAPRIDLNPSTDENGGTPTTPTIPEAPPKHPLAGYVSPNLASYRVGQ